MLRPIPMKKLSAVVFEDKKDRVLNDLKEKGLIQFIEVKTDPAYVTYELDPASTTWIRVGASDLLSKIDSILDVFRLVKDKKNTSKFKGLLEEQIEKMAFVENTAEETLERLGEKILIIEDKVQAISLRIEKLRKKREDLLNAKDILLKHKDFGIDPRALRGLKKSLIVLGTIPFDRIEQLEEEIGKITEFNIFFQKELSKELSCIAIISLRRYEVDIHRVIRIHQFEELSIPFSFKTLGLDESFKKIESGLSSIHEEETRLLKELKEISDTETKNLLVFREIVSIEGYVDEVNVNFGKTDRTFLISGWVPVNNADEALAIIENASEGYCNVSIEDPEKRETPPTLLSNPSFAKPLELITSTYGAPNYTEIDPTKFMVLTFPILFGFMFGDLGQGMVLTLLGYLLGFKLNLISPLKKMGRILMLCGIAATIVGVLYGNMFGLEGEDMKRYLGFELHPLLFNPFVDIQYAINFSMYMGLFLLTSGCLVNIINDIYNKRYYDVLVAPVGLPGIWILWGGYYMLTKYGLDIFSIIGDITIIATTVLPVLIIWLGEWKLTKLPFLMAFIEAVENFMRFLVNSISHLRISIMAIMHSALSIIVVMVMDMMPQTLIGGVLTVGVFLAGNVMVLLIEAFISSIQTLRLHFYELFSKFYTGEGKYFEPFKITRKYTYKAKDK